LVAPGIGVTTDLEGRALPLELAVGLAQREVSWLPGATIESGGRALLELVIESTPRAVSWLLGVIGWVELAGTVMFE